MCAPLSSESSSDPLTLLGIDFMDDSHQALHNQLGRISSLPDDAFAAEFEALAEAVRAHFMEEEQAMEEIAFPGVSCHRSQHAQALSALHYACKRIHEGAISEGREIAVLFTRWLDVHISSMDTMLAQFMLHAEAQPTLSPVD